MNSTTGAYTPLGFGSISKMLRKFMVAAVAAASLVGSTMADAGSPRDNLTHLAFTVHDKSAALAGIATADAAASAALARTPSDREAMMVRAMATSYRAQLGHSRADALAAKTMLEKLAASDPKDAEAQAALGGWHIGGVSALGGMLAGMMLGAKKNVGLAAIDRAVALGGNRAMVAGVAGLLRLELDPSDGRGRQLVEAATHGSTTTYADKMMQLHAQQMVGILKSGADDATIKKAASRLLPMGQLDA
jgi:hypothetical protein